MRVSPSQLQAVRQGDMLTRYALLGPVAYIVADLPDAGTDGTGLERPCLTDHHGLVARGSFTVHHEDGRTETFQPGDAFYVPVGPPAHHFTSSPRCVVSGFAPVVEPPDVSEEALSALGLTIVARPTLPALPPTRISLAGSVAPFRREGRIDVEGSVMGPWLFMHVNFGPRSGYTAGWCDLPHWGLVLDGEVAITYADHTELAARGDVYYTPGGHKFTSPDGATTVDYTPIDALAATRVATWRRAAIGDAPGLPPAAGIDATAEPHTAVAVAAMPRSLEASATHPG